MSSIVMSNDQYEVCMHNYKLIIIIIHEPSNLHN